jgi:hypothetical protein
VLLQLVELIILHPRLSKSFFKLTVPFILVVNVEGSFKEARDDAVLSLLLVIDV